MNKMNFLSKLIPLNSSKNRENDFDKNKIIKDQNWILEIGQEKEKSKKSQEQLQNAIQKIFIEDKESPLEDSKIIKDYVSAFSFLSKKIYPLPEGEKESVNSILSDLDSNNKRNVSESDIKTILWLMHSFDKRWTNKTPETITTSKWSYEPDVIKVAETYNCSWWAIMFSSIMKAFWVKAYPLQVYHHVVSVVSLWDKLYRVDPIASNKKWFEYLWLQDITDNKKICLLPNDSRFWIIKLKNKILSWDVWYLYNSIEDANKYLNWANYRSLVRIYDEIIQDKAILDIISKWGRYLLLWKWPSWEDLDAKTIVDLVEKLWGRDYLYNKSSSGTSGILNQEIFDENREYFHNPNSWFIATTSAKK